MRIDEKGNVIREEEYRAILVAVAENEDIEHSLDELEALSESAGVTVIGRLAQNLNKADPATYIGSGKLRELGELCANMDADTVILNDELTNSQLRHLEDALSVMIIDRTVLILDIFARRAKSREGKLQVEFAQLQYRLPRLRGIGKALSRLGAGIGTRGPGEKQLEIDRRHIMRRMGDIKHELKEIQKQRRVQRGSAVRNEVPMVALVGYTNAGKSAMMNAILNAGEGADRGVSEEDKLFATLDTYKRNIKLPSGAEFVLIDTVGFVSKLPHDLVDAFKGTLEEISDADMLLHIIDASNQDYQFREEVVNDVLHELNADSAEQIKIYNKIDLVKDYSGYMHGIRVSAKTGMNIELILERIEGSLFGKRVQAKFLIPYHEGKTLSKLHENAKLLRKEYVEDGTLIEAELNESDVKKYSKYKV